MGVHSDEMPKGGSSIAETLSTRRGAGPRVVVVGAGFGGIEVAKALGRAEVDVTVIDRRNHHLFQPLLYQVATAALSAPDIAEPIRSILRRYRTVEVLLGEVTGIDTAARRVRCAHGVSIAYDHLVLATGARTGWLGRSDWARVAPGLKTIEDARAIRARLLMAFERAERSCDPAERARLMTIAVIGGGPTGVEMAGAIAELSRHTLARDFRHIRPAATRVLLVEGADRLLAGFDPTLATYAQQRLERLGVTVMTGQRVEHLGAREISIGGERIAVGVTIWAAGVEASPLGRGLAPETDHLGRVEVLPTLEVPGLPGVFALGDVALCRDRDGRPLPGLAQVAKQQGIHLGRGLLQHIRTGAPLRPFVYRNRGNTAIVGRHAAVYEIGRFRMRGRIAWLLWAIVHVYLLVGFQHRVLVSVQWLWRYLTYERGARLIPDAEEPEGGGPATADDEAAEDTPTGRVRGE